MKTIIDFISKHQMLPSKTKVLCAVSGGADSMCLLHFLSSNAESLGITVAAAHFNHRLRGAEADRDQAFVEAWCNEHGIVCEAGSADVAGSCSPEPRPAPTVSMAISTKISIRPVVTISIRLNSASLFSIYYVNPLVMYVFLYILYH